MRLIPIVAGQAVVPPVGEGEAGANVEGGNNDVAGQEGEIVFPFYHTLKLTATREYLVYPNTRGQGLCTPEDLTDDIFARFSERVDDLPKLAETKSPEIPKFVSLSEWPKWDEQFKIALGQTRSPFGARPCLSYVIRTDAEVSPEALTKVYVNIDDDLHETHVLSGVDFERDSRCVYEILQAATATTAGATYVKEHKTTHNGRAAFLTMKTQAEGLSATQTRKNRCYAICANTTFNGKGNFTYNQ
jgi:hypothetical protein